jgi:mRNA interferase MazF
MDMVKVYKYEVYMVNLDPTVGSEVQKARPCAIISPNEMNENSNVIIVCPITSKYHRLPTRIAFSLDKLESYLMLDQIRAIDKTRLGRKMGTLTKDVRNDLRQGLLELFGDE